MKRKLIWATATLTLIILPVGVVMIEGTTAPEIHTADSPSTSVVPATLAAPTGPTVASALASPDSLVSQTDAPEWDELGGFDPHDILNAPIEQLILGETLSLDSATAPNAIAPQRPELSGVSAGIPWDGSPLALSELDVDALLGNEFFGGVGSDSIESKSHGENAAKASESADATGSDEAGTGAGTQTGDSTDKGDGKRERIEVSLIRPQKRFVSSQEDVIVRTRTKGLKRAFVLVRVRQKGGLWWVQDEAVRNKSVYFRSRARFGNGETQDGVRFCVVVAFTMDDDDVPEAGESFEEIPPNYRLSQEFDVMLKRR